MVAVPEPVAVTVPPESTEATPPLDVDQETEEGALPEASLRVIWKDSPRRKSVTSVWLMV